MEWSSSGGHPVVEERAFDVVVVGAGPAGLAAAVTAHMAGGSVAIINEAAAPGGQIWRPDVGGRRDARARRWLDALTASSVANVRGTVVNAWTAAGNHHLLIERDGQSERVRTARVILATGARELFLPFPGWTLPGVLGVGAAQAMAKGGLDVRGKRIIVAGSGPLLVAVAASLAKRRARIVTVVEQVSSMRMAAFAARLVLRPAIARDALRYTAAIPPWAFRFGSWVSAAHGEGAVQAATITDGRRTRQVDCDLLCVGYGLTPNSELGQLLGCATRGSGIVVDGVQQTSVDGVFAAGECAGIGGVDAATIEGVVAGHAAAGGRPAPDILAARDRLRLWGRQLDATFAPRPELSALAAPDTIVCRCEDVRLRDIDPAWTARQGKLYRRIGMGACQSRVCGPAMQRIFGWTPDRVRAPIYPSFVSTLAEGGSAVTNSGVK